MRSATQATFAYTTSPGSDRANGGKAFTQRLLDLANQKPQFDVRGYGYEIHEMRKWPKSIQG